MANYIDLIDPDMALESAKLLVAAITPIIVAIIAFRLNRALQQVAAGQWSNQKVVEKRIAVFDDVAPALNDLYCFFKFVGDWKRLSPPAMVAVKRRIDKQLYIYEALFPPSLIKHYTTFVILYFSTYSGRGHDAKLRAEVSNKYGDRRKEAVGKWKDGWQTLFVQNPDDVTSREGITGAYFLLMNEFSQSLGLGIGGSPRKLEHHAAAVREAIAHQKRVQAAAEAAKSKVAAPTDETTETRENSEKL